MENSFQPLVPPMPPRLTLLAASPSNVHSTRVSRDGVHSLPSAIVTELGGEGRRGREGEREGGEREGGGGAAGGVVVAAVPARMAARGCRSRGSGARAASPRFISS